MFKKFKPSSPVKNVVLGQVATHDLDVGKNYKALQYVVTVTKTAATAGFASASLADALGLIVLKVGTVAKRQATASQIDAIQTRWKANLAAKAYDGVGNDLVTAVAATFARGNLGYSYLLSVPKALNVDGGVWTNNGGKQVDLDAPAPNQLLFVPGLFNGHRRKQITFSLAKESAADLVVFDENGGLFENLQKGVTAGSVRTYETSSDLYLLGSGDPAGGFFINEIYYAN